MADAELALARLYYEGALAPYAGVVGKLGRERTGLGLARAVAVLVVFNLVAWWSVTTTARTHTSQLFVAAAAVSLCALLFSAGGRQQEPGHGGGGGGNGVPGTRGNTASKGTFKKRAPGGGGGGGGAAKQAQAAGDPRQVAADGAHFKRICASLAGAHVRAAPAIGRQLRLRADKPLVFYGVWWLAVVVFSRVQGYVPFSAGLLLAMV